MSNSSGLKVMLLLVQLYTEFSEYSFVGSTSHEWYMIDKHYLETKKEGLKLAKKCLLQAERWLKTVVNNDEVAHIAKELRCRVELNPYLSDLLYFSGLPPSFGVILEKLLTATQNDKLILNSSLKKQLSKDLSLSVATLEKALTKFVKTEILTREDKGIYIFNPNFFGDDNRISDGTDIEVKITYSSSTGREFKTIFKKTNECAE